MTNQENNIKLIAVDDEEKNLEILQKEIAGINDTELAGLFRKGEDALEFAQNTPVDAAILDVTMPYMDGITLGSRLKECCPGISLIYVTAHREFAYDAFQLDASAYLLKPFTEQALSHAVEKVRRSMEEEKFQEQQKSRIFIRTFGFFEIFVDDKPIEFTCRKAKELLALLVDRRGGIVTTEDMLTFLWEDRPNNISSRNYCRKVVQRLHDRLEEYGIGDIILSHRRGKSLDTSRIVCDYYQYLEGRASRRAEFRGEYMTNYSWAEETLAGLLQETQK